MILIASRDGDRLSNGRIADILQYLDGINDGMVFEYGEGYLFLHDIHCNFGLWLWESFSEGLFDLARTIGASDSGNLYGKYFGNSTLMVL